MNKIKTFELELDMIEDNDLKNLVKRCLENAPDYFYTIPASSSGKYHPQYALGEGGLVRHTKAAVKIANDLLNLEQYHHLDKSEIISALILHDILKKGMNEKGHTVFNHPILAANFLFSEYMKSGHVSKAFSAKVGNVGRLIKSHMGQWNTSNYEDGKLPKPIKEDEKFVHLCDYLASRKYIECQLWFIGQIALIKNFFGL